MKNKHRLISFLEGERNNSQIVLWRIFFGTVMFFETAGALAIGYVDDVFKAPPLFNFTFIGFEFLRDMPLGLVYAIYSVMALASIGIALGYRYKLSSLVLLLGWMTTYFAHKCFYNNHHYLMLLLILALFIIPGHTRCSMDAKSGRVAWQNACRNWHVWFFIALLWIVYTYASVAKVYPDWVQGEPIAHWFAAKKSMPVLGPIYAWKHTPILFAWGGILFDAVIIPLLLFKRTRNFAFFLGLVFHLTNSITFQIGTFPYMMIATGVFFYPPEFMERLLLRKIERKTPLAPLKPAPSTPKFVRILVLLFMMIQIGLPLRHYLFEGPVLWTEEGHKLSWRMMLRSKKGNIHFRIVDLQTGKNSTHFPSPNELSRAQLRALPSHPDLIYLYVQYLKTIYPNHEIYANSKKSLNYRPYQAFIDPQIDLAKIKWNRFQSASWILEAPPNLSFWQKNPTE